MRFCFQIITLRAPILFPSISLYFTDQNQSYFTDPPPKYQMACKGLSWWVFTFIPQIFYLVFKSNIESETETEMIDARLFRDSKKCKV